MTQPEHDLFPATNDDDSGTGKLEERRRAAGYTSAGVSAREGGTGAMATLLLSPTAVRFPGAADARGARRLLRAGPRALFAAFCALVAARFAMHPRAPCGGRCTARTRFSFYFGTFWVSLALILYLRRPGVRGAGERALAGRGAGGAVRRVRAAGGRVPVPRDLRRGAAGAMPAWILPAYPFLVLGPLAGVLRDDAQQPARGAGGTPILVGGLVFEGLGRSLAFILYTVYFLRLIHGRLPEESQRPGMFVAVGPAGYTWTTLAALGTQAPRVIPANYLGNTYPVPTGMLWKATAIPAAMFVRLLGFWFFALALVSCLRGARQMHFTLNWWAFIFPNAGLTIGAIKIANAIDSGGIKGVTSAVTVILVAVWIFVAVMNVRAVWKRQILWPGRDEDMEDLEGHGVCS
ncbi:C4-dicarboxylate transporter/malic acid transport protein-like protein [Xylariomycetidae sp. FL0641]|nr:C4-dicarboxylate transporter/malic acid transport protein-like protein [Xylariomycetidae sp. FL0641]